MFQAMGNTMPSLIASAARIVLVAVPVLYMSRQPWFELHHIWYTAVAAVLAHLTISMLFLRREFRLRLTPLEPASGSREMPAI